VQAEGQVALPLDLEARGFVLLTTRAGRLFAVSGQWGCSLVCDELWQVVGSARRMVSYIEWANANKK
jgi:hypothetical protein